MPTHFKLLGKNLHHFNRVQIITSRNITKEGFSLTNFVSFFSFLFLIELAGELRVIYNLLLWMLTEAFTKRLYAVNNS